MGALCAVVSAITFGLIPLFTLPLLGAGISAESILLYRFVVGALLMGPVLLWRGESLRARPVEHAKLAGASLMYMLAALTYFHAFRFLPSGMVTTIQYLYPIIVMLVMITFFGERFSLRRLLAIGLAFAGVALLGAGQGGAIERDMLWIGLPLSLGTGLFYALYYIGIKMAQIPRMSGLVTTFHVMVWGSVICLANALATDTLMPITGWRELGLVTMLALVTAVISNLLLIIAIKHIGPTKASIVGATEPLTAVLVGLAVFDEPFSLGLVAGVALIVSAVTLAVGGRQG